jgi:molybdopterin-guanine dinucleotide biosynthesis protein A
VPEAIQPVVLVGGKSRRFGRDKLREPVGGASNEWLVDRPIAALRAVFGPVVAAVGDCDAAVAARFDRVIPDRHPGAGPIGGIVSALGAARTVVFVLAGDLPRITPEAIRSVLQHAEASPLAWAVMAAADRLEPCVALYRPFAAPALAQRLASGQRSLHDAIPREHLATVSLPAELLANANEPRDLA